MPPVDLSLPHRCLRSGLSLSIVDDGGDGRKRRAAKRVFGGDALDPWYNRHSFGARSATIPPLMPIIKEQMPCIGSIPTIATVY
jgi:hypothetical protein